MRMASLGVSFLISVVFGGYALNNHSDFTVEVRRPLPEVYSEFSGVRTFGSGLREYGFDAPRVIISRPSDHELVFRIPAGQDGLFSTISFAFSPSRDGLATKVSGTLDIAPIKVTAEKKAGYLSADKLQPMFKDAVADFAKQLNNGNSTAAASNKLAMLIDGVAIFTNPEKLAKFERRLNDLKAGADRVGGPGTADRLIEERRRRTAGEESAEDVEPDYYE